jgi:hypothetical protein
MPKSRTLADLAVQRGLRLLPQRWSGTRSYNPDDFGALGEFVAAAPAVVSGHDYLRTKTSSTMPMSLELRVGIT